MINVLMVDDEPALLELSKVFMERDGKIIVTTANSGNEILQLIQDRGFDAIVSNYQMPEMDGIQLLERLRIMGDRTPFILFTGKGREEVVIDALNRGADFYLRKGGDPRSQFAELINMIRQAISRREAEDALEHNARRFRTLIENSSEIVGLMDREGKLQYISPSMTRILGFEPDDLIGRRFMETSNPEEIPNDLDATKKAFESPGSMQTLEMNATDSRGRKRIMEVNMIVDPESPKSRLIINGHDITERKRIEDALRRERERYLTVFANTGSGTAVIERDTTMSLVNEEFARMVGYTREEIEGKMSSMDFIVEEDRPRLLDYHWRRREDPFNAPRDYEYTMLTRSGEKRQCRAIISMVPDTNESIVSIMDLTEFKRMRREIATRDEELARILNEIDIQVWYINDPETYGLTNRARREFLGVSQEEIEGKKIHDIVQLEDEVESCLQGNRKTFKGKVVVGEEWVTDSKGRSTCQLVMKTPLLDEDGKVSQVFCTATDITERKRMEDALRITNEKMNLMVSVTRHDIMNQIGVIKGYLDLMKEEQDLTSSEYMRRILDALDRVERHLNFTKEVEVLGQEPAFWCRASDPIRRAFYELDMGDIEVEMDPMLEGIQIFADSMIWKVFYNLAHNTLEHAPEATMISVHIESDEDELCIVYEDDGRGLPETIRSALDDRDSFIGSGYGLYLVREILSINRINLSENGQRGGGVRFSICVPNERWCRTLNSNHGVHNIQS
jgi:PAS domain S-box-containing protein